MDFCMDIASMSMSMQQLSLQSAVSTALLAKTMDSQAQQMDTLLNSFSEVSLKPPAGSVGHNFDVNA